MAVILFFVGCIQLFFLGSRLGVPHLGFVFYVWVGIFSLTTIAQFWSYANELYTRPEGDRLFPLIAVGSTAGAPLGAALAGHLFARGMGPFLMMQVGAGLLLLHLVLYRVVGQRASTAGAKPTQEPMKAGNGFDLVLRSPYLRLAALFLVLLNFVNTVGEFILGRAVVLATESGAAAQAGFSKAAFIGLFYGSYFLWVSVATILIQAFLVSRLVKRLGMAGAFLALPVVALEVYGLAAAGAGLWGLRWLKTAENSTRATCSRRGSSSHLLSLGVAGLARVNIAIVLLAIGVAALLLKEYARLTVRTLQGQRFPKTREGRSSDVEQVA